MSTDSPAPVNGETVTPQQAWNLLCGAYLNAAKGQLRHSVVCPNHDVKLQMKSNTRGKHKYRVVCATCKAQQEIPSEPDWFAAWELINAQDSKIITLPG